MFNSRPMCRMRSFQPIPGLVTEIVGIGRHAHATQMVGLSPSCTQHSPTGHGGARRHCVTHSEEGVWGGGSQLSGGI